MCLDGTRFEKVWKSRNMYEFHPWKFSHLFAAYRCISPWNELTAFSSLSFYSNLCSSSIFTWKAKRDRERRCIDISRKNWDPDLAAPREEITFSGRMRATLIHRPIWSTGVQIPRWRRSIFINGSALTSPGTCVTVNAHSTERCGTLSLSMTDITHSRTSAPVNPLW